MSSKFIGVAEAAAYLDVTERWIYRQSSKHGIPRYRFGGKVKFKVADLEKWARQQRIY